MNAAQQFYYGHGKLLLTGEYFVLDGAESIALPTSVGQSMNIKYKKSFNPILKWKSYDYSGKCWFEAEYEFWRFNILKNEEEEKVQILQKLLQEARRMNPHFLRDGLEVEVETRLGFPISWGLGSSSSLIYNVAQWAYVSPFELAFNATNGSAYDIACAQSDGPISYKLDKSGPSWKQVNFNPKFSDNIFFVYLNEKKSTKDEVNNYHNLNIDKLSVATKLSVISNEILSCENLSEFESLITLHENIVSEALGLEKVKDRLFSDYWGSIKSLGAWGGDFVLVTSDQDIQKTREYFNNKGYATFISFNELVRNPEKMIH